MKRFGQLLAVTMLVGSMGLIASCDEITKVSEGVCGPCGDIYAGDNFISGDARLDGVFKAVGTFGKATAAIDASFKADVMALGEVFGLAEADLEGLSIDEMVAEVKGAITAELNANVEGSLSVQYAPPKCSANVSVAVEAQASCEASAGCDVSAECEAGSVEVKCEGSCSGGCSAECDGTMKCSASLEADGTCGGSCEGSCELSGPSLECEGTCTGGCALDVAGECSGECQGNCDGTCSFENTDGECKGECDGTCTGKCEVQVEGECSGECSGKCEFTPPSGQCEGSCKGECKVEVEVQADCEGEITCEGSCGGSCSGGCEGNVEPPSCSAEGSCDASADCQASASAQASASVECTPPSLEIGFEMSADLDAQAKAEFLAKMELFKVRMIGVIQGMFKMRALVDAEYAAEIGIEAPVVAIKGQVEGLISGGIDKFDIPAGRIACVIPAFEDSVDILVDAGTDLVVTFQAQMDLVAVLDIM